MTAPDDIEVPQADSIPASAPQAPAPVLYTVREAAAMLRLGRTVVFALMRSGRLRSVREGRARRITAAAIADYVKLLEREAAEAAQ